MKRRSGEAVAARSRTSAGPMRHRLQGRGGARNNHAELLEESDDDSCCASPQDAYHRGEMSTPYEIQAIIDQMGGKQIFAMAFKSCAYATSPKPQVTFLIAPALKRQAKMSHVRVTLEPSDTYKVEFINVRGINVKTISEHDDIYCDMLKELVEAKTGLYLTL